MSEKKIIVIGSRNYANRRIIHELKLLGFNSRILDPQQILPFVNNKSGDRLYIQKKGTREPKRLYKNSLSAVVPRIGKDLQFFSKSVEHIENNIGIPTTASAQPLLDAQDKIRTIQLLSQAGIKTPKTFAVKKVENLGWVIDKLGGFPVVAKLIYGSQGIGVFILTEPLSASTALEAFSSQGHSMLLQQFVETADKDTAKHDFRYVVVDGKVVGRMRRNSVGDDFRTNASIHEDCEPAPKDDEMDAIAIKAAAAVGLACAGVDLARDVATGEVYCYEVNGNFNFKSTERYTKVNIAKYIAEYAVKLAGEKQQNNNAVIEGAKTSVNELQAKIKDVSFRIAALEQKRGINLPTDFSDQEPGINIDFLEDDPGLPYGSFPSEETAPDECEFGFPHFKIRANVRLNDVNGYIDLCRMFFSVNAKHSYAKR